MKFKILFPLFLLAGFLITSVAMYLDLRIATSDFIEMTYTNAYQGTVENCTDYKGSGYVILSGNQKYVLRDSRNYNYTPYSVSEFLQAGDVISKKKNSNDLLVRRGGTEYIFKLGEDIEKTKVN